MMTATESLSTKRVFPVLLSALIKTFPVSLGWEKESAKKCSSNTLKVTCSGPSINECIMSSLEIPLQDACVLRPALLTNVNPLFSLLAGAAGKGKGSAAAAEKNEPPAEADASETNGNGNDGSIAPENIKQEAENGDENGEGEDGDASEPATPDTSSKKKKGGKKK